MNLSSSQFRQLDLAERILGVLEAAGVDPQWLELELTESTVMEHAEQTNHTLKSLCAKGLKIAIDDFGTGYSSLSYLKRFPVDKLKVDRSFVLDIPDDQNDAAIASAVIQLATSLGLKVVAEGVETEAQRAFLVNEGCNLMQGFLYSRPLDGEGFARFMRANALQTA